MKEENKTPPTRGENASASEEKRALYERQKRLLDTFLANGALTRAQYEKSLGCLTEKMGFSQLYPENTPEGLERSRSAEAVEK